MPRDWSTSLPVLHSLDRSLALDVVIGPRTRGQVASYVALPVALAAVSFAGYATDAFAVGGGCLVIYPATAALLGAGVAFGLGAADRGLLLAILTAHGAATGYLAASAAVDYAGWGLAAQARVLLRPDAHAYLGVLSAILALGPFLVGAVLRYATTAVRGS